MQKNSNKIYEYAFKIAFFTTLLFILISLIFLFLFYQINWLFIGIFSGIFFICSFLIILFGMEKFIAKSIQTIYEDVTILGNTPYKNKLNNLDIQTFVQDIDKYTKDRKLEIEKLKVREAYRKEFLGNVSHELKTPLFTVQGYVSTLLDGAIKDKKVRTKYLQNANKGVDRLIYIVKDLDMITKLEAGNLILNKELFDIVALTQNVFQLLEMKASKKNISLIFNQEYQPILVNADKEKIQQVLTNLVVNSIKYGSLNGTTEVSIDSLKNNQIRIRIADNGEGISKEHLPRLFERFYRVDKSGSRKEGGSGLGLAIVKHIIEAHQQKVFVESEYGIGSEFSFTLEKANPQEITT